MSKRLGGIKGCKVVTLQLGTDGCHQRGFSGGIDRCRRDPGYVQYHRNNDMLS